ncbi:hypothetical protein [Sneathiella sp.]|uniref:hypothetical protein n=1 Tax=Sneathiella sp. TaxID=1964365 RepID=UPI00356A6519
MTGFRRLSAIVLFAAVLASCASEPGGTNNPIMRPFQWFSYANGDDIRNVCVPGRNSRYRLIYNALYDEQVRTYDIVQLLTSKEATQVTRVFSGGINADWNLASSGFDPHATQQSREIISISDLVAIEQALIKSGFEQPAIKGQILHSDSFYWIAMVCRDGIFKYYAWTDRNADIKKLPFREVLAKGDETGVALVDPYAPTFPGRGSRYYNGRGGKTYFTMQVGDNGLIQ